MKYFVFYLLMIGIGILGLFLSHSFSSQLFTNTLETSLTLLQREGTYPSVNYLGRSPVLDNFTDALMLNTAWSVDFKQPLFASLTNQRHVVSLEEVNQISNLKSAYEGNSKISTSYERYWHGYLIFLRPLLLVFDYSQIRILISLSLLICSLSFVYLAFKRGIGSVGITFLVGLLAVDILIVGKSLQFSSVFIISILGLNLLLLLKDSKNIKLLFFLIGCVTSYFDLLTAPLITLGLPLLLVTFLEQSKNQQLSLKKSLLAIFYYCLMWFLGYLIFWAGKWLVVESLFIPNAVKVALNQIINRTVTEADSSFNILTTIWRNMRQLTGQDYINAWFIFLVLGVSTIYLLIKGKFTKLRVTKALPYALIGSIPFFWMILVANHSYLHCWYTYRILVISIVAWLLIVKTFTTSDGSFNRSKKVN